ncbi:hypothetical protein EVAR_59236_1 [Eumeta japonica]|uniref:Uncharacterized protein n=1 Tax=Eumeta variegata TaxID=151549 RepID=A0A4C1ZG59_EUMVA|nr:hypothetical protein EVAR_59236_1 [Eumeta japonica]
MNVINPEGSSHLKPPALAQCMLGVTNDRCHRCDRTRGPDPPRRRVAPPRPPRRVTQTDKLITYCDLETRLVNFSPNFQMAIRLSTVTAINCSGRGRDGAGAAPPRRAARTRAAGTTYRRRSAEGAGGVSTRATVEITEPSLCADVKLFRYGMSQPAAAGLPRRAAGIWAGTGMRRRKRAPPAPVIEPPLSLLRTDD